ncbi:HNH endonuclease [Aidingimonas lacisalsi]|uniref:HNH endonuclease n=1 Tax=Aidingimonas lacisalsi TaxID=2604086 RepID=UPI0011D17FD5|nr:HNH endonuclease [Aidingimonas lacisalsi]
MPRKPGPGLCVHCVRKVAERNWDHVFPQSWYPDTTPDNLEKWKIPSCKKCNGEYGRLEEELGTLLSACIDPTKAQASGIWEKTLRSLDPSQGKDEKDKRIRAKRKERLLSQILEGDQIPSEGVYPGLGERWGRPRREQHALLVPAKYLERIAEKVVRGLAYIQDGQLLGEDVEIEHLVVAEEEAERIEAVLAEYGSTLHRGPGVEVHRAVTPDDGVSSFSKITIWGQFVMYVSVIKHPSN